MNPQMRSTQRAWLAALHTPIGIAANHASSVAVPVRSSVLRARAKERPDGALVCERKSEVPVQDLDHPARVMHGKRAVEAVLRAQAIHRLR